ncbi:MAG TPA: SDR family oxidoreductase, partial [Acidimicrobiales bacterium]|nr:SDR family oxidoreductase [Acidimicrobiales bacterium]
MTSAERPVTQGLGAERGGAEERVAVITGGGSGIGEAAVKRLAQLGFGVVAVGRRPQPLEKVAQAVADAGGRALAVPADLADPLSPAEVVSKALERFGRLDIIVNNAAVIRTGPLDDVTPELVDDHYAVNVRGPLLLVKAALPALRESPDAAIVNVSSSVGSIVKPGNMLYGSTKAALEYLTRAWAYELAEDGIRVNCIAPGPVDTPIHATYSTDLTATYADLARRVPLLRMGHVDDIATWVCLLVAPGT